MNRTILYVAGAVLILFNACKGNDKTDARKIAGEWIGKTIKIPPSVPCLVMGRDTVCPDVSSKLYRVLVYTDSIGCTSCKLRIDEWKQLIRETDTIMPGKVAFLLYFNPKKADDLPMLLRQDNFRYPIYIDKADEINRLNGFPEKMEYQSFLLDKENKVLLIGNPTLNPQIWELYKQVITGV